jgi:Holliday junction resolvase RusA-like endonuclease
MRIFKPRRGDLIAIIPIFQRINPLARPRLNYFSKTIYQPKENQKALLSDIAKFEPMEIAFPVLVDTYINFVPQGRQSAPTVASNGDEDNLRKAISDALQHGKILVDDRYILGGENYKAFGIEDCCLIKIWAVAGYDNTEEIHV